MTRERRDLNISICGYPLNGPAMLDESARKAARASLGIAVDAPPMEWFTINAAEAKAGAKKTAEILIYDIIDPWGVNAGDFANALNELEADEITVGINSPGGLVFDGIAIMNALKRHPAKIITRIDGLAASAASFIAMAGDEIVTSKYAEMMIHEARGVAVGTAKDMKDLHDLLIRHNNSIAAVYADRAGGEVKDWLRLMRNETWFTADEMVAAGLADRILEPADESSAADETESLKNRFDLSIFNYAGRGHAPKPAIRMEFRAEQAKGAAKMATTKEYLAEKFGLDPALDDEAFNAALDEKLTAQADPEPQEPAPDADAPADEPTETPELVAAMALLKKHGVAVVDSATLEALKQQSQQGSEAFAAMQAEANARMVDEAIRAGKIRPADREKWVKNLGVDRETYAAALEALEPVFPTQEVGHAFNPDPAGSMQAPDDLSWFDTAPTEPPSGVVRD